jgi:hypothetical protein
MHVSLNVALHIHAALHVLVAFHILGGHGISSALRRYAAQSLPLDLRSPHCNPAAMNALCHCYWVKLPSAMAPHFNRARK